MSAGKPSYTKPHLSFDDQLALLQSRGMVISDRAKAEQCLKRIGYYRLSAYWYPFRKFQVELDAEGKPILDDGKLRLVRAADGSPQRLDTYQDGTAFSQVLELYVFDKKLRLILLDAIERIEIAIRVDISHHMGAYDPFAYEDTSLLHGHFSRRINTKGPKTGLTDHEVWLSRYGSTLSRSREDFVKHFNRKYGGRLPIWVAVELWDFGMLSTFYQGMLPSDQLDIAQKYGVTDPGMFSSWLRNINHVRNICAHHGRLWNRNIVDYPKLPTAAGEIRSLDHLVGIPKIQYRVYSSISIIQHLLHYVNPASSWPTRLQELIATFPVGNGINIQQMGFPPPAAPATA